MWFLGLETMLAVTEPHILKELLLNKNGIITKDIEFFKKLSPLLGKGLVTTSGKEWALHRRIVSPAFLNDSIKVTRSFMLSSISISIQLKFDFPPCINPYHAHFIFQWPTNTSAIKCCPCRLNNDSNLMVLSKIIQYLNDVIICV